MAVLFYIITKVKILEAFNFHGFASSAKIAKINRRWNVLVLQCIVYICVCHYRGPDGRTRQFFGPYAYRYEADDIDQGPGGDVANTHFRAIDFAGFPYHYLDDQWFKNVKERWQSNTYGLTKFTEKPMIRSDLEGSSVRKFELYPLYYQVGYLFVYIFTLYSSSRLVQLVWWK